MMMATTATSESDIYFVRDYVFLGWYRTNKPGPLRLINARPSVAPFGDVIADGAKIKPQPQPSSTLTQPPVRPSMDAVPN
jgi:hypothetical protein